MGIHFVGGHKHTDRVCEGKATQLCQSCDIFVEFWVSILPSSKIFCWTEGCTQPLPASINCVYSFNEFMCLWCGLKVKLIPDGRAHYYTEREICKILWTIYYQNCWEWKQPGEWGGDITQVTQLRVQYVRSSNERQGEYVFRISYFAADWFCQLIIIMEPQAWEESRNVFWWQINKINTPAAGGGISSTHSNLTTQKLIREKIISFHITNRIFIACVEVDEDFLWSQLEIISSRTSPGNHFPIHLRTGYEL